MKKIKYRCDWCGNVHESELDEFPSDWIKRDGQKPVLVRDFEKNEKWFDVGTFDLHFCTNECNQAAKNAEAKASIAARDAWLQEYNKYSPN